MATIMKSILFFFSVQLGLFASEPSLCIHLLNRSAFGIDKHQLTACLKSNSYEHFVEDMVYTPKNALEQPPVFTANTLIKPPKNVTELNATERMTFNQKRQSSHMLLKTWLFETMLKTNNPFEEHMLLFWHNHFTSSLKKVGQAALIYRQHELLKENALGNFATFLHDIIKDPAMLIYLDNRASKKSHPNENLARELLELFTLGEGNYKESDIKALARGLTGYGIDQNFNFRFNKNIHDQGEKTFLGKSGNFDADEMIDIILEQDATSLFIVKKLWYEYIGYEPDAKEVQRLAKLLRDNHYELKPLMVALFTSPYFTASSARATMIKSPIELIIGTLRSFGYEDFDTQLGIQFSNRLGQNLFDPPNVKGWEGKETWINTNTLLIRKGFLNRLSRGDAMKHLHYDLFNLNLFGNTKEERAAAILLPIKVLITPGNTFDDTVRTILQHPLYQLK
jgi:uncharacterized protein (DUF1800 family)